MWTLVDGIITNIIDRHIKKSSILLLGIDGAGKTTILESILNYAFPDRKPKTILPTMGLNTELLNIKKYQLRIWDVGGKTVFRSMWENYIKDATLILFVVNCAQEDRLHESRKIFDNIICTHDNNIAVIFLNSEKIPNILTLFPSAYNYSRFFLNLNEKDDIGKLLEFMKSTAE